MTTPAWVQDTIFYQIFPDRFANGDPGNDPPNVQPWGSPPTLWGFQGGDLRGIIRKFDYLLDLGINAIYLNPIFTASSVHRYNTTDYFHIDPKLGTLKDFRQLLRTAHRNGIRVILDGVFNHCGRGFPPFYDVLENGEHSAFCDWFYIHRFPVDAYPDGEARNYAAWWNNRSLPKLNTNNPKVRQYLFSVARYWIEMGADGWRLDVPNEINDDSFWEEFRHIVKTANPEAYLVGEIWTADPRWVNDTHFDGLMNYPLRDALLRLLAVGTLDMPHFAEKVEHLLTVYPSENTYAMYLPLGSHDTERLYTKLEGNLEKVKLAFLFQMAYPGAPAVYYGDEVGLEGGRDPDCRRAFPWKRTEWKQELRRWVKKLIALRKETPALRRGGYRRLLVDTNNGHYVFARELGQKKVVAAINAGSHQQSLQIPCAGLGWKDGQPLRGLTNGEIYLPAEGQITLTLPPWSGVWISE